MTSKSRGSSPVNQSVHLGSKKGRKMETRVWGHKIPQSKRAKTLTDLVDKLTGKSDEKRNSF